MIAASAAHFLLCAQKDCSFLWFKTILVVFRFLWKISPVLNQSNPYFEKITVHNCNDKDHAL